VAQTILPVLFLNRATARFTLRIGRAGSKGSRRITASSVSHTRPKPRE